MNAKNLLRLEMRVIYTLNPEPPNMASYLTALQKGPD